MPDPSTPTCNLLQGCTALPAAQWSRRLTDVEFATVTTAELARRDAILLLADPSLPPPQFGPMPTPEDCVHAVWACSAHAITVNAAAHVHAKDCVAPDLTTLPTCNCTPEPIPIVQPGIIPATVTLETGWTVPAPPVSA